MKKLAYFLVGAISLCLLCFAAYGIFLWIQSLQPKLVWEPLFIDESSFPSGWTKDQVRNDCVSAPLDSGCDNYQAKVLGFDNSHDADNWAGEVIRYYDDKNAATKGFPEVQKMEFSQSSNATPFSTPEGLNYQSVAADQYSVGCQKYTDVPISLCAMVAQYNRFIIIFSIRGHEVNPAELRRVFQAIDEKMRIYKADPPFSTK